MENVSRETLSILRALEMIRRRIRTVLVRLSTGSSSNRSLKMAHLKEANGVLQLSILEAGRTTKKLGSESKSMRVGINTKEDGKTENVTVRERFGFLTPKKI